MFEVKTERFWPTKMNKFVSLEFSRNLQNDGNIYKSEIEKDIVKITAGNLPPLEVKAKPDDFMDVYVSHVENSAKFYVQLKGGDIGELQRKMNMVYANPNALKSLLNPQPGQCCAIKNEKDQLWYRAVVISRVSPSQAEVYMFDYGHREKVLMTHVKELHAECGVLPAQAIECKLQNVEEKEDEEMVKKFRGVCQKEPMVIRLVGKEGTSLLVTLFKVVNDHNDFNINEYLTGKVAAPIGSIHVAPSAGQGNTGTTPLGTRSASDSGQGGGSTNQRGGRFGGSDFRGGARGGGTENRGTGFGERASGFGDRPSGNFGADRSNFRGGRGGERGARGSYSNGRGGFGDRGERFGDDNNNDRGGGFGSGRGGSISGDGSKGKGQFSHERGRGFGRGGYNRDTPRSGGFSAHSSETSHEGTALPKEDTTSPGSFIAPKTELVRPALKVNDVFTGTVIQADSPFKFWITTARESGFNRMPDAMWDYAKTPPGFVKLAKLVNGASCLFLKQAAGDHYPIYCRATITGLNGDLCDLWLVDYAEAKKGQPVADLFQVPPAFAILPRQAIRCQLADAEDFRSDFNDENKKKIFSDGISQQEVTATVKGVDEIMITVEIRIGAEKRNLRDVCKSIAAGYSNAFGIREGM